jgi:hypothetical protein
MWRVTGWALVTLLRITGALVLGVGAAWLWLPVGWFVACAAVGGLGELWAIRQLAREWAWQARGYWWWSA